jgi:hypothetical protein
MQIYYYLQKGIKGILMMANNETTAHVLQVITNMSHGMSNVILNYDLNMYLVCSLVVS